MIELLVALAALGLWQQMRQTELLERSAPKPPRKDRDERSGLTSAEAMEYQRGRAEQQKAERRQAKDEARWRREDIKYGRISRYNPAPPKAFVWNYAVKKPVDAPFLKTYAK